MQKVFCIGFQKTGTTSFNAALTLLGYRVASVYGRRMSAERLRRVLVSRGLRIAARHDAVEDMPWPLIFRELDAVFPGSKFILTERPTDKWYKSIAAHFGDRPYPIQQVTYGDDAPAPIGHEERYRAVYEAHNAAVREHFKDRPGDLLVFSFDRGDGWPELGRFLGLEHIPEGPFIRRNLAQDRSGIRFKIRSRINRLLE